MKKLELIKSANFGESQCDIYGNGKEFYMTREQVGKALEYSNPQKAVDKIHERNRDRLDKYSVTVKLGAADGKNYTYGREVVSSPLLQSYALLLILYYNFYVTAPSSECGFCFYWDNINTT